MPGLTSLTWLIPEPEMHTDGGRAINRRSTVRAFPPEETPCHGLLGSVGSRLSNAMERPSRSHAWKPSILRQTLPHHALHRWLPGLLGPAVFRSQPDLPPIVHESSGADPLHSDFWLL